MSSVTIGIPLYNEEEVFGSLLGRLEPVVRELKKEHSTTVLFIDDGSTDDTPKLLDSATQNHSWVNYIRFSRNFGHQVALTAILDHCTDDILITLDGDLQDPPELIPQLIQRLNAGNEVVFVYRKTRDEPLLRRLTYSSYYRLLKFFWRIPVQLDSGDYAAFSRKAYESLRDFREVHRFHRGLRSWIGFRQEGIGIERGARSAGSSKYSLWKLFNLAFDGIFAFSIFPIRFSLFCGILLFLAGFGFSFFLLASYVAGNELPTIYAVFGALTALALGVNFVFLGIIGEYVGRIYEQVKGRPQYLVERFVRKNGREIS
ncbi:MAG: glycosyltransferase family 2 protein [Bdellovibrionales bacterium]|nr:glycosyltransferase family 2 protein [Bdellovibrionales bacterium]